MTSYPIIILLFSALQLIFLFFLQENELQKALIPFIGVSILFCTVTTVLAIMLKRSNSNKDKLLAEMQVSLSSLRETDLDGEIFEDNLRSAELTTRFQQPRLNVQQQSHSTAPERYRYIQSMVEMGLSAQKIAATLSMSLNETTQIINLIKMANPPRQNDSSPLPLPEVNNSRSNQHVWLSRPVAMNHESHLISGDRFCHEALCEKYLVSEVENTFHLNHHAPQELPVKNCASHQAPASAQSGVVHKSRKLARWLKIRALPLCLRSQGGREPPRKPLPHTANLSPAPLSGYT
jgi:hypothetical protein